MEYQLHKQPLVDGWVCTPHATSSSTTSLSPWKSGPSSLMSDPGELARQAALKPLARMQHMMEETLDPEPRQLKRCKPAEARQWDILPPPTITQPNKRPTPYLPNLTPMPSPLRPHCLAKDRLRLWAPTIPQPPVQGNSVLSEAERTRIKDTMIHAWEEDTRASYGAGLLMWHCFCDSKGVPEPDRPWPAKRFSLPSWPTWLWRTLAKLWLATSVAYRHGTSCMVSHGSLRRRKWTPCYGLLISLPCVPQRKRNSSHTPQHSLQPSGRTLTSGPQQPPRCSGLCVPYHMLLCLSASGRVYSPHPSGFQPRHTHNNPKPVL
jgi:hypothetical protein